MKIKLSQKLMVAALALSAISTAVTAAPKKLSVVNAPLSSWTSIAATKGWFKEEFDQYGVKVALLDQGTGQVSGQEAALLTKGDIHFANRMSYPALIHRTNGLDARIIWQSVASDMYRTPILTLKESPVNSLADLKGKNFGGGRVGCGWSSPWEAFREAGIPLSSEVKKGEVNHIVIEGSASLVSAIYGGQVDAFATHIALQPWANLVTQGVLKVVGRNSADGQYVNGAGRPAIFAMREFADQYPQYVQSFLKVRLRTTKWIQENPDAAASIISRETRVPKYVAKFQITDPSTFDFIDGETSYAAATASIKSFQQAYKDNEDTILNKQALPDAQIDSFVDKRFFKGGQYSIYN